MITAVIPAYNEADSVGDVVTETREYVDEVLVVDDASDDDTAEVARRVGADVLIQESNAGYIPAIKRGFREATGDIVVTVDADGEMPVERIPHLVAPIQRDDADMVQGARAHIPRPSERLLTWLASLVGPVGDSGTGFRALRTDLARRLQLPGTCICGILALEALDAGARLAEIPIQLRSVEPARGIAWFHAAQLVDLLEFVASRELQLGRP